MGAVAGFDRRQPSDTTYPRRYFTQHRAARGPGPPGMMPGPPARLDSRGCVGLYPARPASDPISTT
eukprot:482539-Hanusia_phi.AAC.1